MKLTKALFLILSASFVSAFYQPMHIERQNMDITPTGMNADGQFVIASPGDIITHTSPQIQSDWDASSGMGEILHKPTVPTLVSQLTNDSGFTTASAVLSGYVLKTTTINGYALSGNISVTSSDVGSPSGSGTSTGANTGDQTLPSVVRTTSTLSLSLVGAGATGTQISATKDSSISCCVSTSTTSTIGGPSTSLVVLKICSTNNATEGSWTTVSTLENDQTITLAIALQSTQVFKGQLYADVPAGWYVKLVNSGTGTHSESFLSGQQTIYG